MYLNICFKHHKIIFYIFCFKCRIKGINITNYVFLFAQIFNISDSLYNLLKIWFFLLVPFSFKHKNYLFVLFLIVKVWWWLIPLALFYLIIIIRCYYFTLVLEGNSGLADFSFSFIYSVLFVFWPPCFVVRHWPLAVIWIIISLYLMCHFIWIFSRFFFCYGLPHLDYT